MELIVTVDENWAIGKNGLSLAKLPAEYRNREKLTLGNTVIMGRKTFLSLPQEQPLYGRENIVLSSREDFSKKGITVAHSVEEVLKLVEDRPGDEIFVCGGEGTYRALLPHCDVAHVLFVEMEYDANHYMENLDKSEEWELVEESDEQTYFDMTYYFRKYVRVR